RVGECRDLSPERAVQVFDPATVPCVDIGPRDPVTTALGVHGISSLNVLLQTGRTMRPDASTLRCGAGDCQRLNQSRDGIANPRCTAGRVSPRSSHAPTWAKSSKPTSSRAS